MTYFDFCKNVALDKLDDFEDGMSYACDLASWLTMSENNTGSWYCSRYKAMEDIKNWFLDLADFVDYYKNNFGYSENLNVFKNPEVFHCLAIICGVEAIVNQCKYLNDNWDNKVVLDYNTIQLLKKQIKSVKSFGW